MDNAPLCATSSSDSTCPTAAAQDRPAHQRRHHPLALRQGWSQPPSPVNHRLPALQRRRTDGLFELQAWLGHRDLNSTQHYAKIAPNASPRPTEMPANSGGTSAPSRSSSTLTLSPLAPPPSASLGPTCPAPSAASTLPRAARTPSLSRPRRMCSACSLPSRSPTTNAPPWTTVRRSSISPPPPRGRRHPSRPNTSQVLSHAGQATPAHCSSAQSACSAEMINYG